MMMDTKVKELVINMGMGDIDVEKLLSATPGSKEMERIRYQRESVAAVEKLTRVNRDLERKMEEQ
jgi:hypothetical protein